MTGNRTPACRLSISDTGETRPTQHLQHSLRAYRASHRSRRHQGHALRAGLTAGPLIPPSTSGDIQPCPEPEEKLDKQLQNQHLTGPAPSGMTQRVGCYIQSISTARSSRSRVRCMVQNLLWYRGRAYRVPHRLWKEAALGPALRTVAIDAGRRVCGWCEHSGGVDFSAL
jgi:hypothetical protein